MIGMITCKDLAGIVSDYLDERLPLWTRAQFHAHLAICANCREWVRQLESTRATLGQAHAVEVPDELAPELLAAFQGWTAAARPDRRDGG
jgi:anti-sigma factor RsiW